MNEYILSDLVRSVQWVTVSAGLCSSDSLLNGSLNISFKIADILQHGYGRQRGAAARPSRECPLSPECRCQVDSHPTLSTHFFQQSFGGWSYTRGKFVNSSLNNPVFNIHGETIYDRLNSFQTELRERALKPKRQGNLWLTMAMLFGILAWVVVIGVIIAGIYYYYYYCDTHRCDIKNIKTYLQ